MVEDVVIEPMTGDFILWRCLHWRPLSRDTIDEWSSEDTLPWSRYRERNLPLLRKLTETYGTCAMIARDGDEAIGQLRFYPKAVCDMVTDRALCMQQDYPAGPPDDFADREFPDPSQIADRTLIIHCLMAGSSLQEENPYHRKGIGTRMVEALIEWARANGWEHIEVEAFEDLPVIYDSSGSAGHTFWEKLGFHLTDRYPHPALQGQDAETVEFVKMMEEQAASIGIPPERAADLLVMRFDLT